MGKPEMYIGWNSITSRLPFKSNSFQFRLKSSSVLDITSGQEFENPASVPSWLHSHKKNWTGQRESSISPAGSKRQKYYKYSHDSILHHLLTDFCQISTNTFINYNGYQCFRQKAFHFYCQSMWCSNVMFPQTHCSRGVESWKRGGSRIKPVSTQNTIYPCPDTAWPAECLQQFLFFTQEEIEAG